MECATTNRSKEIRRCRVDQQLKKIKIQLPIGLGLLIDLTEKGISELLRIVEVSVVYEE